MTPCPTCSRPGRTTYHASGNCPKGPGWMTMEQAGASLIMEMASLSDYIDRMQRAQLAADMKALGVGEVTPPPAEVPVFGDLIPQSFHARP